MSFFSAINPMRMLGIAASMMTGGLPLYFMLARELFSAIGQDFIERAGRLLGLPQSVIDMAQASFSAQMGDVDGVRRNIGEAARSFTQAGFSAVEQGGLERTANEALDKMFNLFADQLRSAGGEDYRGVSGKSLLVAIAIMLGKVMDQKLGQMYEKTQQLGNLGEVTGKNQAKYGELSGEISALGQELNFVSQAMNNTIKSIGEAARTVAGRN